MRLVWIALWIVLSGCCGCPSPCAAPCATGAPEPTTTGASEALTLLEAADQVFRSRKYAESRAHYERALAKARELGDKRVVVESLAQLARTWSITKEGAKGEPFLEQAKQHASPDEPWGWTRYLGVRGIFEREAGDKDAAVKTFEAMYAYAMDKRLHRRAIDAAHHVAIAAPPEKQVEWGKRGIAAAEALGDDGWLAVLWNNLGATYEDLERYEDALAAYEKARRHHHKGTRELPKMIADWAVGHAHRLAGHPEKARRWLERTLAWAERIEDDGAGEWVGYCLEELGLLEAAAGNDAKALPLLERAHARFLEAGLDKHWPEHVKELEARIEALRK